MHAENTHSGSLHVGRSSRDQRKRLNPASAPPSLSELESQIEALLNEGREPALSEATVLEGIRDLGGIELAHGRSLGAAHEDALVRIARRIGQ